MYCNLLVDYEVRIDFLSQGPLSLSKLVCMAPADHLGHPLRASNYDPNTVKWPSLFVWR